MRETGPGLERGRGLALLAGDLKAAELLAAGAIGTPLLCTCPTYVAATAIRS